MNLILILFGTFFALCILGIPIAVSLGLAATCGLLSAHVDLSTLPQRMVTAVDSFSFMAIPFFMLAGKLMETGGISRRLIDFVNALLRPIKAGLAITTVIASSLFAALSGSSPGTVAAIGGIVYPELVKNGYNEEFAAGLITVSGGLGPIIPPSILMVTLGVTTGISIIQMFMGGVVVGVLCAIALIILTVCICAKKGYGPKTSPFDLKVLWTTFYKAIPALGMPLIILGGIYGGLFTPTEAAAISVVYAFIVGLVIYREFTLKTIAQSFYDSAVSASVIMLIIATSTPFSWIFARQGLATLIAGSVSGFLTSPVQFLVLSMIILLIFGTFMEGNAIILLLMPFLYPIAVSMGVDLVHFGVMSTVALVIGCCSPPVAVNIYTACGVSGLPASRVIRGMMPFFIIMVILLFVFLFFPALSHLLTAK